MLVSQKDDLLHVCITRRKLILQLFIVFLRNTITKDHGMLWQMYIERKHGSQKAIIAVARKMLAIMYVMLTRNEPYHGENPQLTERKHKRLDTLANTA